MNKIITRSSQLSGALHLGFRAFEGPSQAPHTALPFSEAQHTAAGLWPLSHSLCCLIHAPLTHPSNALCQPGSDAENTEVGKTWFLASRAL